MEDMADYHYTPNPEGRISSMVSALKELDCEFSASTLEA